MNPLILIILIIGIPLLLFVILRVKPLYLFVSIVTGYLWVLYLGEPAELVFRSLSLGITNPGSVAKIFLLLVPLVISLLVMRKSLPTSALPFQFFLLVANSLLLATIAISQLPTGVQNNLYTTSAGAFIRQTNDVLIAGIAGLHVLVMWIMNPRHHKLPGKHKKR